MSNAVVFDYMPDLASTLELPAGRGRFTSAGLVWVGRQTYATDSIGTTTVTFSGVNAGSEIRVYLPDATEAAGVETCSADHSLTWQVYAPGSANNTVRVVIVHPDYKIKEFTTTSSLGNASLPVQQEADKWYSNPV
jgi:hypothetical protein